MSTKVGVHFDQAKKHGRGKDRKEIPLERWHRPAARPFYEDNIGRTRRPTKPPHSKSALSET